MTSPPRRRRRRRAWAGAAALAVLAGCTNDPGVRATSADALDGAGPPDTSARPAPTTTDEQTPDFTLPPLTLPEPVPASVPEAPTGTPPSAPPAETRPEAPAPPPDDLAASGDSLYPEVGNDGIDVQHYLVRIGYDPAVGVIEGEVTITARALRDLDELVVDAVELEVADVTIDDRSVGFVTTEDELVIDQPLDRGADVVATVTYRAAPSTGGGGFGVDVGWFATAGGSYVLNEPNGLRHWMPADDHPADKATWRFELTVPDGLAGIANGAQLPSVDAGADTTWIWEQREPMATYLVQLLTGDYEVVEDGSVGDVSIVHVALTDEVADKQPYFDTVGPQIEYFETVFGPYPLDRYGLAFTESWPGLAMETQGRSMFSTEDFPPTRGPVGYFEDLLLSHELAHQWFGNAVSPSDWGDLWLNESFATYGQWLWFDHTGQQLIDASAQFALSMRQEPTEPTGTPTVDNLFGVERYDGGAVVLHALRLEVGDEDFFTILSRWAADNDGTSRSTAAFVELAEEVADRPLTAFFDAWLFRASVPEQYPD